MDNQHIVMESVTLAVVCTHCGQRNDFKLPIPFTDWCDESNAFIIAHTDCKPKETKQP